MGTKPVRSGSPNAYCANAIVETTTKEKAINGVKKNFLIDVFILKEWL